MESVRKICCCSFYPVHGPTRTLFLRSIQEWAEKPPPKSPSSWPKQKLTTTTVFNAMAQMETERGGNRRN